MNIALCANGTILPGLHATLASLVANANSPRTIQLYIFIEKIDEEELDALRTTITKSGGVGFIKFVPVTASVFGNLRSLQGDYMTYMRLYLPEFIEDCDRLLYLDSDLVITTDLSELYKTDLRGAIIGAAGVGVVRTALERPFFVKVGLSDDDRSFNGGVLLIDAKAWRKNHCTEKLLEFGHTHSADLVSADQAILVANFSRLFFALPREYNINVAADSNLGDLKRGIYHFVGSPKPWDLFGSFIHRSYHIWGDLIGGSAFSEFRFIIKFWREHLRRAFIIRRSYARVLLARIKSK